MTDGWHWHELLCEIWSLNRPRRGRLFGSVQSSVFQDASWEHGAGFIVNGFGSQLADSAAFQRNTTP